REVKATLTDHVCFHGPNMRKSMANSQLSTDNADRRPPCKSRRSNRNCKMVSYLTRILTAGAIAAMVISQPLLAQGTDFKKFFEELSARGVKTGSLDADKFFAELAARGVSSSNRMTVDKFFE